MTFDTILRGHLSRYPVMQIQDVYKLIHQASMGSEHAASNAEGVRKWMERELAEMGDGIDEPMIDPISADGQIVRVHLRPFVACGGNTEMLLNAFINTANEFHGDVDVLKKYWGIASGMDCFPSVEMDGFIKSIQVQDYPAMHHSSEYERLYRPAYRVVRRKFIA